MERVYFIITHAIIISNFKKLKKENMFMDVVRNMINYGSDKGGSLIWCRRWKNTELKLSHKPLNGNTKKISPVLYGDAVVDWRMVLSYHLANFTDDTGEHKKLCNDRKQLAIAKMKIIMWERNVETRSVRSTSYYLKKK